MKFHLKMTFSMLALLSFLFGIGGSMLISASFKDSLEREETSALGDYRMAWGTLQIVNQLQPYLDRDTMEQTMEQIYQQSDSSWTSLKLSTADEILYEAGYVSTPHLQSDWAAEHPNPGDCLLRILDGRDGTYYLVLSGAVETNGELLFLTGSHNITLLYTARTAQQHTYLQVFFVMCLLCSVLSYTISRVLTSPLKGLSRASRRIASGNYASRVRIRSQDEIGRLTQDFNAMAEQLQADAEQREL